MVLIQLRAPILSLCITIISVICELAFLTAALTFMRYNVCRRLQKKQRVTVRSQHVCVLVLTLFAMLAFVTIETVTSIFSDPQEILITEIQPCARNVLGRNEAEFPSRAEAIHFKCAEINGISVSHFEGNFSIPTNKITCAQHPVYSYDIAKTVILATQGTTRRCREETCVFVKLQETVLYFTGPQRKTATEEKFLPSNINPDFVKMIDVGLVADKIIDAYIELISEEGEVRRRGLLGSIEDKCPFSRESGSGTTIPLGVIIGAALVWASSLLFFFASLIIRKRIFFDITHPMHWARKVRHDVHRQVGTEPELEVDDVDGEQKIIIFGYMNTKVD